MDLESCPHGDNVAVLESVGEAETSCCNESEDESVSEVDQRMNSAEDSEEYTSHEHQKSNEEPAELAGLLYDFQEYFLHLVSFLWFKRRKFITFAITIYAAIAYSNTC